MKKLLLLLLLSFGFVGSAYANYEDGLRAYNQGNYRAAFIEWKTLVGGDNVFADYDFNPKEQKHPDDRAYAQFGIGYLYENGLGVNKSLKKAYEYYKLSTVRDNPRAQLAIAQLILRIIKDDLIEGIDKKARLEGYREASEFLIQLEENIYVTEKMLEISTKLWNKYELWKY